MCKMHTHTHTHTNTHTHTHTHTVQIDMGEGQCFLSEIHMSNKPYTVSITVTKVSWYPVSNTV